jgi:hypothetical protein
VIPKKSKHKNAEKYRKYGNYQAKWEIIQCQQKYFPRVAFFFIEVLLFDLEMHYKIDYAEHHGTQNHDCQIVDKPKEITVIPMADTSAYPQTVVVKPQHTGFALPAVVTSCRPPDKTGMAIFELEKHGSMKLLHLLVV